MNRKQVGDYIKFIRTNVGDVLGEISYRNSERVKVKLLRAMNSVILQWFNVTPINQTDFPLASQDNVQEVYQSSDEIYVKRSTIIDVAFIIPVAEVESGMFFLSGVENTFCIRYILVDNKLVSRTLSQHLRRTMYHQAESVTS